MDKITHQASYTSLDPIILAICDFPPSYKDKIGTFNLLNPLK